MQWSKAPANDNVIAGVPLHYQHFREFMTTDEFTLFISSLSSLKTYFLIYNNELSCYQGEMLYEDLRRAGIKVSGAHRIVQ